MIRLAGNASSCPTIQADETVILHQCGTLGNYGPDTLSKRPPENRDHHALFWSKRRPATRPACHLGLEKRARGCLGPSSTLPNVLSETGRVWDELGASTLSTKISASVLNPACGPRILLPRPAFAVPQSSVVKKNSSFGPDSRGFHSPRSHLLNVPSSTPTLAAAARKESPSLRRCAPIRSGSVVAAG